LPCGYSKWIEDTRGMTSQQKLEHLIHEMNTLGRNYGKPPEILLPKASLRASSSDLNTATDPTNQMEEFVEPIDPGTW
uniref:Transposase n=1 Tax=Echinostoma caproni TaxID=27848 RepID=A0A183A0E4_9TREM